VASRNERCGFLRGGATVLAGSVSGVIRLVELEIEYYGFAWGFEFGDFVFGEEGIGDDVFFGGPVAEVAVAAALAAEGEGAVDCGVRGRFADWTFVEHGADLVFQNFAIGPEGEVYIKFSSTGTLACAVSALRGWICK
jgi:hypothetical protein